MTTIAIDKTHIAWDSLIILGDSEKMNCPYDKARVDGKTIYAAAGCVAIETLIEWHKKGKLKATKDEWELVVINRDGIFHASESSTTLVRVDTPFAIGSGAQYARGAMLAGMSAKKAVEIAAHCDAMTGGEIKERLIAGVLKPARRTRSRPCR